MKIKDILDGATDKQPIGSFTVKITRVYERNEGEGKFGPWSFQNASTEEGVLIKFDGHPDRSNLEGKEVSFEAYTNKSSQYISPKAEVREKDGKVYRSIRITKAVRFGVEKTSDPVAGTLTEERVREICREEINKEVIGDAPF